MLTINLETRLNESTVLDLNIIVQDETVLSTHVKSAILLAFFALFLLTAKDRETPRSLCHFFQVGKMREPSGTVHQVTVDL